MTTSAGASRSSQTRSSPLNPSPPLAWAGTTTRSTGSAASSAFERVPVGAAALDAGVDRDALGGGALLDRLQDRHRPARLGR